MMSKPGLTTPLEEAQWVYSRLGNYDRQQRFDAAISLAEWGVFSLRQIAKITGISHTAVAGLVQAKNDKSGGKLDPEALEPLVDLMQARRKGEDLDPDQVVEALDAGNGTSPYMASKLTDIPRMHLVRRYERARKR